MFMTLAASVSAQLDRSAIDSLSELATTEGWTFTVNDNPATQYPLDQITGLKEPEGWRAEATFDPMLSSTKMVVPNSFDWRDITGLPPIRNQGGCGSCWAFATVGVLECAIKIREGQTVDLSEQWLVSCNSFGYSCAGGWYALSLFGAVSDPCEGTGAVMESDFPYQYNDGTCRCPYPHPYQIDSWAYIGNSNSVAGVDEMKRAILEYGPIAISFHVNNAFQSYHSGVFNYCTDGDINHAVLLVGWDDSQGQNGVWILRNSWGSYWGENGYMRIEYSCCQVGYAACYADYRPVQVSCQNDFGPSPLAVEFQAECPGSTVTGQLWEFGDGATSTDPTPTHVYENPGCYTVTLTVETSDGDITKVSPNVVSAHADTMSLGQIEIVPGGPVRIDVMVRNTLALDKLVIPFCWAGDFGLAYDSFSVADTRTEYFYQTFAVSYDPNNSRAAISLTAGNEPPLAPGDGVVASLWFTAPADANGVNPIELLGYSRYLVEHVTGEYEYTPSIINGYFHTGIEIGCCDGRVGDVNQSGEDTPTIGDVSTLIDHLFISGVVLACIEEADVNQSGGTWPTYSDLTIGDVSLLIDHLFISGGQLPDCF